MAGPWEDYQKSTAQDSGPWQDYYAGKVTHKVKGTLTGREPGETKSRTAQVADLIEGTGKVMAPGAIPALALAPGAALAGAAGAAVGEYAGKKGAKALGASEDTQRLSGDVGGIVGGSIGPKAMDWFDGFAKNLASRASAAYHSLDDVQTTHIDPPQTKAPKPLSAKAAEALKEQNKNAAIKESSDRIRSERGEIAPRGDPAWKSIPDSIKETPAPVDPIRAQWTPRTAAPKPEPPKRGEPRWKSIPDAKTDKPALVDPIKAEWKPRPVSPKAKASLPEPKTGANASGKATPGQPPVEQSEAAEAIQAKTLGKVLRQAKIRPDDAAHIKPEEWPMVAKQAKLNAPSEKVIRMALEENRKLWASGPHSQGDLEARRKAFFAQQNQSK